MSVTGRLRTLAIVRGAMIMIVIMVVMPHMPAVGGMTFFGIAQCRSCSKSCIERNGNGQQESQEKTHGPKCSRSPKSVIWPHVA